MRRPWLIPLLLLLGPAMHAPLLAQWKLVGETGMSRVKQTDLPEASAFTIGGSAETASERWLLQSSVLGALTNDDRWTGQALVVGAFATPAWRTIQLQTSGAVSLFGQTSLGATTSADALVQVRAGDARRGAAIGGGGGTTAHNAVSIPVARALADAWLALGDEKLSVEAALTRTRSVFGGSSIFVDLSRKNVTYADVGGAWRHERGGWSFGAGAGVRGRNASFSGAGANAWTSIDAAAWITSRVALAASAGRTLEDLVRGVPRTRYVTVALRLSSEPHATVFRDAATASGPRMTVTAGNGVTANGMTRIELRGIRAARVDVMGDFTGWTPVPLVGVGDVWVLELTIAPGPHRLAIRVDHGAWIVPVNLPRVEDDLGGTVGLVTVP